MAEKKRILVTAKWCGACPVIKKELKKEGVGFREIDIDSKEGRKIDSKHKIHYIPTMIINGKQVSNPKKWV